MSSENDWNLFKLYFEQVNKNFFTKLQEKHERLTINDLKLAALIKLNMNIKEAAAVLNIEPDSLKRARYRLRQKFGLRTEQSLSEFLDKKI
jgi:DNA-binding CsgD family transcriptional regulator